VLEFLAMVIAMSANEQPMIHSPSFECTPVWFHLETGIIGCADGTQISLWGITLVKPRNSGLAQLAHGNALASSFRAREIRRELRGYVQLIGAPAMICHSEDRGVRRIAQCFVKGAGVFGGEDLACVFIRTNIAAAKRHARKTYSICSAGQPKLEVGETEDVVEDRT
jgi:hypothetical protein